MTKTTRDVPTIEGMTVADRLKVARTDAGLTRKALAEATGVPSSTLEKYERGDMDPNTTRLQTICECLEVSVGWILNGDAPENIAEASQSAEIKASASSAENPFGTYTEPTPVQVETELPVSKAGPLDHAREILDYLDQIRANGFDGMQRRAMALTDDIRTALKYFGPDELLTLASEHRLYKDENCLDASGILGLFTEDVSKGQTYCSSLEERILDTAILGIDLYCIERDPLVELADKLQESHGIEPSAWGGFSWGDHKDFVPLIRPHIRALSFSGTSMDFTDQDKYPRREE